MNSRVADLLDQGQSIWQDDISRAVITGGGLKSMIDDVGVRGVTSNPSIFENAISSGADYDEQIVTLAQQGLNSTEIFERLAIDDIRDACDLFRPIYDASQGGDGFVSIEVAPDLARDSAGTREQVRRLWDAIDRPNLMVKIPGTIEGAPIVEEMLAEGKNINITLLFSIEAYERVARGYLNALRTRLGNDQPIDRISSVASFFVSRVDVLVDELLDEKIETQTSDNERVRLESLKGKSAVANAKLAYQLFKDLFGSDEFGDLKEAGARVQRPLWASTSTKNPDYSDTLYVDTLIGPHTINTMPSKTIHAFIDHGVVRRTIDENVEESKAVMKELAAVGIDFDAVTDQLENEGIDKFIKAFDSLLAQVESKRSAMAAASAD